MLSIGELAHRTGVSRRMLRHWEQAGLIVPAEVDPWTAFRRYAPHQAGRVRAIAALRAVDFGLDAIRDLLASGLTEQRLVELLRTHETELSRQITEASARRSEVRSRLAAIEEGHHTIMQTLELSALPALKLAGVQETVTDESEIGEAAARLLSSLRSRLPGEQEIVLTYDGTTDPEVIVVTAGVPGIAGPGLAVVEVAGADRGAAIRYAEAPPSIGDAWITLDTALEVHELRTYGVYRQTLELGGGVLLQAPVTGVTLS